jgi:hypothetical protein
MATVKDRAIDVFRRLELDGFENGQVGLWIDLAQAAITNGPVGHDTSHMDPHDVAFCDQGTALYSDAARQIAAGLFARATKKLPAPNPQPALAESVFDGIGIFDAQQMLERIAEACSRELERREDSQYLSGYVDVLRDLFGCDRLLSCYVDFETGAAKRSFADDRGPEWWEGFSDGESRGSNST